MARNTPHLCVCHSSFGGFPFSPNPTSCVSRVRTICEKREGRNREAFCQDSTTALLLCNRQEYTTGLGRTGPTEVPAKPTSLTTSRTNGPNIPPRFNITEDHRHDAQPDLATLPGHVPHLIPSISLDCRACMEWRERKEQIKNRWKIHASRAT
ncbi:uncharacterized protein LY79DRAFT_549829 [Colletotrichum navitas]|uniref:Uncharacterized protein n=1 Tax=Colletotrichum navitas TaxID=681940 RepID=A0AAD8V6M5_9PEZI|nr:uncharacterized protein LY79DRAFT_549829 [Colletotrichum navitas]KAK1594468.1 hypothetical protein LY79DRAFT_549829 [Colletotrichum navitas]